MKRLAWAVLLAGALLGLIAQVGTCQGIGIFLRHDRVIEYGAGAGLDVIARGPWIAKGFWRHPIVRVAGTTAISFAYEKLLDYNGWNANDFRQREWGLITAEVLIDGGRLLWRAVHPHHGGTR